MTIYAKASGAVALALGVGFSAGAALAVCTNKPLAPTRAVLRHLDMERLFVTVIAGDSLPTRKPDPAMLHAAFAALGGDGLRI